MTAILKRLTAPVNAASLQFTIEIEKGAELDTGELQANKEKYRDGGGKFQIAHQPGDYAKSNSVDSVVTATQSLITYRIMMTTSGYVALNSDDTLVKLPFKTNGSNNPVSLKLTNVRFYDEKGLLLQVNTMEKPLEIKLIP
ncbi:hypothetical protein M5X17_15725 [Paenibacillus alvei]|uniref:hypothetical protein n=1 Tax=Paenibacillus alvei TaxID=44250 RepID=UPI002281A478|nr:hypothetical protein [Paenibacillus alvei]MCY9735167.1 hypothetical protein [Paenibacillus alvei]